MTKFLIAAHGYLADGLKSTIGIIMGEDMAARIETMNLFVEDTPQAEDAKIKIDTYFKSVSHSVQIIVCTDLLHGSVNQFMMEYADDTRVFLITGVNLPLLCELVAMYGYTKEQVSAECIAAVVERAREETIFVNAFMKKRNADICGREDQSLYDVEAFFD